MHICKCNFNGHAATYTENDYTRKCVKHERKASVRERNERNFFMALGITGIKMLRHIIEVEKTHRLIIEYYNFKCAHFYGFEIVCAALMVKVF